MKYLGCIEKEDFEPLSQHDKNTLLVSMGIFETSYSIRIPRNGTPIALTPSKENIILRPTLGATEDFYGYLLSQYENEISAVHLNFFYDFNNKVFGLEEPEKKKLALGYFKQYCNSIINDKVDFIRRNINSNAIHTIENCGRLELLHGQQRALKDNLTSTVLFYEYLYGNQTFFTQENIPTVIDHFISFESTLRLLISLNDQYGFEKDADFSSNTSPKEIEPSPATSAVKNKKGKRIPVLTDKEAISYLLKSVFGKHES